SIRGPTPETVSDWRWRGLGTGRTRCPDEASPVCSPTDPSKRLSAQTTPPMSRDRRLGTAELEQVRVDSVGVRGAHAVWQPLIHLQDAVLEEPGGERRRIGEGHDSVVVG